MYLFRNKKYLIEYLLRKIKLFCFSSSICSFKKQYTNFHSDFTLQT